MDSERGGHGGTKGLSKVQKPLLEYAATQSGRREGWQEKTVTTYWARYGLIGQKRVVRQSPPPPWSFAVIGLRAREGTKIFDVKELIGKIFWKKHLAPSRSNARKCAQATYLGGQAVQAARSDVTRRRFTTHAT